MADYKELLRRAVEALPENNGAARRAVYEKARSALVGQLRAINPPLAARDITTHRLQLEDCIRQVEQEASEAVIAGLSNASHDAPPPPVYFEPPQPARQLSAPGRGPARPQLSAEAEPAQRSQQPTSSIEDIIAAADRDAREQSSARNGAARSEAKPEPKAEAKADAKSEARGNGSKPIQLRNVPPEPVREEFIDDEPELPETPFEPPAPAKPASRPGGRPLPAIVARAEAAKSRSASTAFGLPVDKPYDAGRRGPTLEARRDAPAAAAAPRLEPARAPAAARQKQIAAQPMTFIDPPPQIAAMSAVREVELEPEMVPADPQGLIDRAMATLDREARGETLPGAYGNGLDEEPADDDVAPAPASSRDLIGGMFPDARRLEPVKGKPAKPGREDKSKRDTKPLRGLVEDADEPPVRGRRGRDRDAAPAEAGFPRARAETDRGGISAVTIFLMVFAVLLVGAGGAGFWAWNEGHLDLNSVFATQPAAVASAEVVPTPAVAAPETAVPQSGPGNTTLNETAPAVLPELKQGERLPSEPVGVADTPALAIVPEPTDSAQRLGGDTAAAAIGDATSEVAALNPEGSQSLLLEASDDGKTGAVPFSGTVEWSQGKDETGLPTLVGKASIPARNLGVDIIIRKNVDTTLPASHLMEVSFKVSDSFIGGSVAGLPGVLLKNEELVQGQPLVGASARVVGNSFLFALSSSPEDITANNALMTSRKWIDLAVIYATGKRAIITLEKDNAAETMFNEVYATWASTASAQ